MEIGKANKIENESEKENGLDTSILTGERIEIDVHLPETNCGIGASLSFSLFLCVCEDEGRQMRVQR